MVIRALYVNSFTYLAVFLVSLCYIAYWCVLSPGYLVYLVFSCLPCVFWKLTVFSRFLLPTLCVMVVVRALSLGFCYLPCVLWWLSVLSEFCLASSNAPSQSLESILLRHVSHRSSNFKRKFVIQFNDI